MHADAPSGQCGGHTAPSSSARRPAGRRIHPGSPCRALSTNATTSESCEVARGWMGRAGTGDVGGEEHSLLGVAEALRGLGAGGLRLARVDLHDFDAPRVEELGKELSAARRDEEDNDLGVRHGCLLLDNVPHRRQQGVERDGQPVLLKLRCLRAGAGGEMGRRAGDARAHKQARAETAYVHLAISSNGSKGQTKRFKVRQSSARHGTVCNRTAQPQAAAGAGGAEGGRTVASAPSPTQSTNRC